MNKNLATLSMFFWRYLLIPFSWIYGLFVFIRNFCYDKAYFGSKSYSRAVIGIGNIRVGGTGKSPFIEYLIRLLQNKYSVSTLSRGYGRMSKGFLMVTEPNAAKFGDEPSQFKFKFSNVKVAVSEDRIIALDELSKNSQVILLDDIFQNRKVKPGQTWVLMDYRDVNSPVYLIPAGNYREGLSSLRRADAILITKCPNVIDDPEKRKIKETLNLLPAQKIFFSSVEYGTLRRIERPNKHSLMKTESKFREESEEYSDLALVDYILVFTGIARNSSLKKYLEQFQAEKQYLDFPDHYPYTPTDIQKIVQIFETDGHKSKILLTTEKDAQRLMKDPFWKFIEEYPVYSQPIEFKVQTDQEIQIQDFINRYVCSTLS